MAKVAYHLPTICDHIEFYNSNLNELKNFILHFRGNCDILHELVNNLQKLECELSSLPSITNHPKLSLKQQILPHDF